MPPLVGGVISEDTLWACTTCGYCETACPIELEHLPRFFRMRQHRVMMDGEFPHELKAVFAAYESQSNPWGFSSDTRADWARDLDVPIVTTPEQVQELDYLYYVGSAESFDPRGQKVARAIRRDPARGRSQVRNSRRGRDVDGGMRAPRRQRDVVPATGRNARQHAERASRHRIVTGDPHAFNSLRNEYPEFGGRFEVIHHTQLIAQLACRGPDSA